MRKVILFNMVTLDGFFERINHSIDWHTVDKEFNGFAIEQLNSAEILIFGRKTYELMAGYWPSLAATNDDPMVAFKMNTISKIVVSRTLKKVDWENTRLIKENIKEEITTLKNQSGKDLYLFGSAELASVFIKMKLIDEFRIMINPVAIGQGKALFVDLHNDLHFRLLKTRKFISGNILLYYEIIKRD